MRPLLLNLYCPLPLLAGQSQWNATTRAVLPGVRGPAGEAYLIGATDGRAYARGFRTEVLTSSSRHFEVFGSWLYRDRAFVTISSSLSCGSIGTKGGLVCTGG